jgi:predicted patatin/cPLA2 family phospholipase
VLHTPGAPEATAERSGAFGEKTLGACKHPVIVPAINYSAGQPQLFKTPHHASFKRDHQFRLVDVALATSAAPAYFPRHTFNNNQYVDGGLYANAPGLLALHEAQTFLGQQPEAMHLMSIGTMSSKYCGPSPQPQWRNLRLGWNSSRQYAKAAVWAVDLGPGVAL